MSRMILIVRASITLALLLPPELACGGKGGWGSKSVEGGGSRTSSVAHEDLVMELPGQEPVGFDHYAGFVTVNEQNGRALFYWFYEAEYQPHRKPLVLWLNGGPGCSSVGYGATQEMGPFLVDVDGKGVKLNPHSWNKEANMLFVESPVGVGFSYSNTSSDYSNLGDNLTTTDAYAFLFNWFRKFPAYRKRPFYIAGESYAGKYVPELADAIYEGNKDPSRYIALEGILLGNPETCDAEDWIGWVDYAWSHAVISDETHKTIRESCNFWSNQTWRNKTCSDAVDEVLKQYNEIDMYSLYTPVCNATRMQNETQLVMKKTSTMMPRMLGGYDPCLDNYSKVFYNKPKVQKALHVSDGHKLRNWSICNETIFNNWNDCKPTVLPIYKKLIAGGIRIWVYSGDTDGRVPVLATRYNIASLNLPTKTPWRPWYYEKKVSGWFQEYEGLTFATFRGAGHAVPSFKPGECLALFTAFLHGKSLPTSRYST